MVDQLACPIIRARAIQASPYTLPRLRSSLCGRFRSSTKHLCSIYAHARVATREVRNLLQLEKP